MVRLKEEKRRHYLGHDHEMLAISTAYYGFAMVRSIVRTTQDLKIEKGSIG